MIDRAVLLLQEEYPIAAGHVTDRLGRPGKKRPPLWLGAPELRIVLQHLGRVALRVEGNGNKGDLGAELLPERVLNVDHLLRQQGTDVRAAGIYEAHRHDLAVKIRKRHWLAVLRDQGERGRRPDYWQPLIPAGIVRRQRRRKRQQRQCEEQCPAPAHVFSSRLSSFKKRQLVPSARILFGGDLIKPVSCRRRA